MTVSEKEIKERDLDIQAQQYQKLFYESPAGMLLLDSDGIVIKANQAILDITGYEFDEVVGKRIFDLFVENVFKINQFKNHSQNSVKEFGFVSLSNILFIFISQSKLF